MGEAKKKAKSIFDALNNMKDENNNENEEKEKEESEDVSEIGNTGVLDKKPPPVINTNNNDSVNKEKSNNKNNENLENKQISHIKNIMEALRVPEEMITKLESGMYEEVGEYLRENHDVDFDFNMLQNNEEDKVKKSNSESKNSSSNNESKNEDKEIEIKDGRFNIKEGKKLAVMGSGLATADKSRWDKSLLVFDESDDVNIKYKEEKENKIKLKLVCEDINMSREIEMDKKEIDEVLNKVEEIVWDREEVNNFLYGFNYDWNIREYKNHYIATREAEFEEYKKEDNYKGNEYIDVLLGLSEEKEEVVAFVFYHGKDKEDKRDIEEMWNRYLEE